MTSIMPWKVYSREGSHVASCVRIEDAVTLVASYGEGAMIRAQHGRPPLWTEGFEEFAANGNSDLAARAVKDRLRKRR